MQLNLLPCYQVVYSEGAYFLLKWDRLQCRYEFVQKTEEKPEHMGNCLVIYDRRISTPTQKNYRLWWIDEAKGLCLSDPLALSKWMYRDGNFLCSKRNSKHGEELFIRTDEKQKIVLTSFPQGYIQQGARQQTIIDDYRVVDGNIWYLAGNDVFYSSEFSLPDGSKGWRFVKDSNGLKNWEMLKSKK